MSRNLVLGCLILTVVSSFAETPQQEWQVEGLRLEEDMSGTTTFSMVVVGPRDSDPKKVKIALVADWNLDGERWKKAPSADTAVRCKWASLPVDFWEPELYQIKFLEPVPPVRAIAFQVSYNGEKVAMFWYPENATLTKNSKPKPSLALKADPVVYDVQRDWNLSPELGVMVVGDFKLNSIEGEPGNWSMQMLPQPFHAGAPIVDVKANSEETPFRLNSLVQVSLGDGTLLKVVSQDEKENRIVCEYFERKAIIRAKQ